MSSRNAAFYRTASSLSTRPAVCSRTPKRAFFYPSRASSSSTVGNVDAETPAESRSLEASPEPQLSRPELPAKAGSPRESQSSFLPGWRVIPHASVVTLGPQRNNRTLAWGEQANAVESPQAQEDENLGGLPTTSGAVECNPGDLSLSQPSDISGIHEPWAKEPWADVVEQSFPSRKKGTLLREARINGQSKPGLKDVESILEQLPVDTLSHGLDRVLFNPGVHWLQDPRSRVYNFTPWLETIPEPTSFAFERLAGFVSSSKDTELRDIARREGVQFVGSTSSLSGPLSHIYFLMSAFQPLNLSRFSKYFGNQPSTFSAAQRKSTTVQLVHDNGVYSIDSAHDPANVKDKNILIWLGTLMEHLLTKDPADFRRLLRLNKAIEGDETDSKKTSPNASKSTSSSQKPVSDVSGPKSASADSDGLVTLDPTPAEPSESSAIEPEVAPLRPAFRYAKGRNLLTRSQLDCRDSRLPGTGVFDIKTRACISIRMDILNFKESSGYLIESQHGLMQSFEREYYDLIRSAFLKYNFQIRIGNMDGVFVAYHNTRRIFGFQYIPITEIDECLFGLANNIGNKVFNKCVSILEGVLEEATTCFPGQSVDCTFRTLKSGSTMEVWVTPSEVDSSLPNAGRQIVLLNVSVKHQLNGEDATAAECMAERYKKWTTDYTIMRSESSLSDLQSRYTTLRRQKIRHTLPTGLTLEEGPEFLKSLNFGGQPSASDSQEFDPSSFTLATKFHKTFRRLARKGRRITHERETRFANAPKVVYGGGVYDGKGSVGYLPESEYRTLESRMIAIRDAPRGRRSPGFTFSKTANQAKARKIRVSRKKKKKATKV